jgi:hypothetical protein
MEEMDIEIIERFLREDGRETIVYRAVPTGRPKGSKCTYSEISDFSMLRASECILKGDRRNAKRYLHWVDYCQRNGGIDKGFDYEMLKKEANRPVLSRLADAIIRRIRPPIRDGVMAPDDSFPEYSE